MAKQNETTKKPEAQGITEQNNVSVVQLAASMPRYVVMIHKSEDKNAVDPVFVSNGDYQATLKRGVAVIAPECLVTALGDAVTGMVDADTGAVTEVPSYPYTAIPYDGDLDIGTAVDLNTRKPIVKH